MSLVVPLNAVPSQHVTVVLGNQNCQIVISQADASGYMPASMFVDLYVNASLIIGGVIAEDRNPIVRDAYLGFAGDLVFIDTQGTDDPYYTGLGARWQLVYIP